MLLREKLNLAMPGEFFGKACFSALKNLWMRISFRNHTHTLQDDASFRTDFDPRACSTQLRGVVDALDGVRRRILVNTLLRSWTKWCVWILAGLIAVAVVSAKLAGATIFIAALAMIGAAAILTWSWRTRPSHYDAARRLDSAAGLRDRISTSIYLGNIDDPKGLVGEQRRDAIARLSKMEPRGFFPICLPASVRRASVLVLVTAGLFAYRIHHKPPLISLLQTTARSQLVQSILSPIVHAMEANLQRTIALVTMKPDAAGDEARRADTVSADDLWKASDDKSAAEDQKDSADAGAGDQAQDQLQAPGNQEGSPSGEARPEDTEAQSQEGNSGNESASGKSQQSEQQGAESRQSLGQSLLQALKNMLSNSPNQQSSNRANQQPPNGQGTPQSGNSHQPGSTEGDKRGESRGSSDAKQKATQTASEGAGSQQGNKELRKDQEMHPVNAVPDRVALEASGFKDQTRMKVEAETGTAQLAVRDQSPKEDAVINGAEQENIPARYRFYVQRYFEHADNGNH
ncbi:MAG TPA: hypothetical protein VGT24_03020 [Candidatus Acidoferrales bacterium]|nr:hypothetical protein [Candidatus Acidoferrales bacterium]